MNKWLSLAAASVVALSFSACGGSDSDDNKADSTSEIEVSFKSISTPVTDNEKNALQVTDEVSVNGEKQTIGFTKLMATRATDNGEIYGLSKDMNDAALTFDDASPYICNGTDNPGGSGSGLDYVSILQKNNKLYMVSQFECQIGSYYVNELAQDSSTGELSVVPNTLEFISQKDEFGGYIHCAGQKTPWETHLGSEEYPADAADLNTTNGSIDFYYDFVADYWGGDLTKSNPYYYGWTPEVSINAQGQAEYTKHYSMGRMSHELAYVMPDNKTVYMSDDGTNVGLFMYVADTAKDLSAGTLYAAKWTQKSSTNGGSADISWIKLGHASDAQIRTMIDPDNNVNTNDGIKFTDIFTLADATGEGTCPTGFTSINTSAYHECIKLNDGKEQAAAFLETRRYAAMLGATTEFRKEEGITFDAKNNTLYVAMSAIERGMEDNAKGGVANTKYDAGGNNDIKVSYNYCGAVYALDTENNTEVGSAYVAKNMYAVITGEMMDADADGNKCRLDSISNPDNVTYLENSNILVIGEDTSKHINNVVWAYDVETNTLERMLTTPLGAETTSPFWYPSINGFGYMTVVTQHPDDSTDENGESSVGVVGPFKNLK